MTDLCVWNLLQYLLNHRLLFLIKRRKIVAVWAGLTCGFQFRENSKGFKMCELSPLLNPHTLDEQGELYSDKPRTSFIALIFFLAF